MAYELINEGIRLVILPSNTARASEGYLKAGEQARQGFDWLGHVEEPNRSRQSEFKFRIKSRARGCNWLTG